MLGRITESFKRDEGMITYAKAAGEVMTAVTNFWSLADKRDGNADVRFEIKNFTCTRPMLLVSCCPGIIILF